MTAPIDRPDWDGATALVPAGPGHTAAPGEQTGAFASPDVEQRYRAMVANRMARSGLPAEEARAVLDPALAAEWDASGGFEARLAQAQGGAIAILERLGPDERREFIAGFDSLPEGVRSTLFAEIALGSSGSVRVASDTDVGRFAATAEGGALVSQWGDRASRNVAVIGVRIERILARMTAEDAATAMEWFDGLPPSTASAIYRMLVGR